MGYWMAAQGGGTAGYYEKMLLKWPMALYSSVITCYCY